jgi:hypothetical protein
LLDGHENHGGELAVDPNATPIPDVQVVVCISPSTTTKKLPGAWTPKNGYDGGVMAPAPTTAHTPGCNTAWYNGDATLGVTNLNAGTANVVTIPAA